MDVRYGALVRIGRGQAPPPLPPPTEVEVAAAAAWNAANYLENDYG